MSKSRKKQRSKPSVPNVSPLTLLRPRLDAFLGNEALVEKEAQELTEDLDAICQGLSPGDFLPILLRAYQSAPARVQTRLQAVVPAWLCECAHIDALRRLVQEPTLNPQSQACALDWLKTAGVDVAMPHDPGQSALFYRAYRYANDFQGLINIFWYTDNRRRKVQGMGFLIDFNPPWEGAVKDILVCGSRAPEEAIPRYVDSWAQRGMPLRPISAAEAKREVLQRLAANRREGIRLPRDLVSNRRLFVEYILSLPDTPQTPRFTAEDFDALSQAGKSVEVLRRFEQDVGWGMRLPDGREAFVLGQPFDASSG
jgi:hypothetical protein